MNEGFRPSPTSQKTSASHPATQPIYAVCCSSPFTCQLSCLILNMITTKFQCYKPSRTERPYLQFLKRHLYNLQDLCRLWTEKTKGTHTHSQSFFVVCVLYHLQGGFFHMETYLVWLLFFLVNKSYYFKNLFLCILRLPWIFFLNGLICKGRNTFFTAMYSTRHTWPLHTY